MNAGSMEVAPSLLNLLRALRDAGYTVDGLPETDDEFWELVQTKGPVLGPYARGAFEEFVATGIRRWCRPASTPNGWTRISSRACATPSSSSTDPPRAST